MVTSFIVLAVAALRILLDIFKPVNPDNVNEVFDGQHAVIYLTVVVCFVTNFLPCAVY